MSNEQGQWLLSENRGFTAVPVIDMTAEIEVMINNSFPPEPMSNADTEAWRKKAIVELMRGESVLMRHPVDPSDWQLVKLEVTQ